MSRVIRYKIWDKKRRVMRQEHNFIIDSFDGLLYWHWQYGFGSPELLDQDDYVIMQFTGLLDRDGKEIYESDIVEECVVGQTIWDGEGIVRETPKGTVIWQSAGFDICQIKKGIVEPIGRKNLDLTEVHLSRYDGEFQWGRARIAVIGNIYENPELLETK